jgi:hypothetical protein
LSHALPAKIAYSVLTHGEIVDLLWTDRIQPLLLKRYPGLSEAQIKEVPAYAYGGAVIQDLGYYPFGSREFSNLVHYVRSGDFVRELLLESQDANEYAFALGALSHYASDIADHPVVNQAVAIQYPKLRAKFGPSVRYARANILDFYSDLSALIETKKDQDDWKNVLKELDQLKSMTPVPIAAGNPAQ